MEGVSLYDSLLTLLTLASWYMTLRKLSAMALDWEDPCDARNLEAHCSKYVIDKEDLTNMVTQTAGNAFVVSHAEYRGRLVALKRWHGAVVPHKSRICFTRRLVRDLDRWRGLSHPNIAPVLGLALHISNLPALVVSAYPTVTRVLARHPNTDIMPLMRDVAAALSYLHAQNPPITHGDLKGSTVFLSPTGTALLSDIGVAAIPQPPDWGFHGVDDARWFAPELLYPALRPDSDSELAHDAESGENSKGADRSPDLTLPVSTESDVYSFGMLAYEMYTRARPFATTTWASRVAMLVVAGERPPRPSREQSPQLTDAVWELIRCCWAQEWGKRPSIDTVVAWLSVLACTRMVADGASLVGECS